MSTIYLATSNPGKVRELNEAAQSLGIRLEPLPNLKSLPVAIEDGETFEQNARIKAEHYSRFAPEELMLAEDSGLAVDQLGGAPGVYSARYAAVVNGGAAHTNSNDDENNRVLIAELERLPPGPRTGKYICVIA